MTTAAKPDLLPKSDDSTSLMTSAELADYLKVHRNAPAEWRAERRIDQPPHVKIGSLVRYRRAAVDAWIDEKERRATNESA